MRRKNQAGRRTRLAAVLTAATGAVTGAAARQMAAALAATAAKALGAFMIFFLSRGARVVARRASAVPDGSSGDEGIGAIPITLYLRAGMS